MKWQDSYIFKYTAHGESAFMKAAEMGHSKTVEEIIRKAKINPLSGTRQIEAIKMAVHQVQIENNKYAFTYTKNRNIATCKAPQNRARQKASFPGRIPGCGPVSGLNFKSGP